MVLTMLDEILADKKRQLKEIDLQNEIERMVPLVSSMPSVRSLSQGLRHGKDISLIAEVKRCSPSKGVLRKDLQVDNSGQVYEQAGAKAISVLTEARYFGGCIEDLMDVRWSTSLPVLRKDFIVEEFQVWESRFIGADAVLLIVNILKQEELSALHSLARRTGLEVLIEVHTERELNAALRLNPEIVGINNRDLKTLDVNLKTTERLAPLIPREVVSVSESGVRCRDDMLRLQDMGIDAVLVGEEIVTSPNPYLKIQKLLGTTDDQD